jgi:hypothetical protein
MSNAIGQQAFEFVYVNQDGSARELSPGERGYLSTKFSGFDGGRPYIKTRYESRDGWGSQSGFMLRRLVPDRITVEPVHPNFDVLEKQLGNDALAANRAAEDVIVTNRDGSITVTPNPSISQKERFERLRSHQLLEQRRREELAKIKHDQD